MEQVAAQHTDVELLFAPSPTTDRRSRLGSSQRFAGWVAAAASVIALGTAVMTFAFL